LWASAREPRNRFSVILRYVQNDKSQNKTPPKAQAAFAIKPDAKGLFPDRVGAEAERFTWPGR